MIESHRHWALFLDKGESLIRSGQGHEFRSMLENIQANQVPDGLRHQVAGLCRRVGLMKLALRVLFPKIKRHRDYKDKKASSSDLAEYSLLLQRIGAVSEAHRTLDQVDVHEEPKALLYRAFCHFAHWDHLQSIAYLQDYVDQDLDSYDLLIGKLNLASAYCVSGLFQESLEISDQCREQASLQNNMRVLANAHELRARVYLQQEKYDLARPSLEEAGQILKKGKTFDAFSIEKWKAFLFAFEDKDLQPLLQIKDKALRLESWETLREIELFSQKIKPNREGLKRLILGTPHRGYRDRIERVLGYTLDSKDHFLGSEKLPVFDPVAGTIDQQSLFPKGKMSHQIVARLAQDFFRPQRLTELFSYVYPDEFFDVNSSTDRTYQAVSRAKKMLCGKNHLLELKNGQGGYYLNWENKVQIRLTLESQDVSGKAVYLGGLLKLFSGEDKKLSAKQLAQGLDLKTSKCREVIQLAIEKGVISKVGKSSATRYVLVNNKVA